MDKKGKFVRDYFPRGELDKFGVQHGTDKSSSGHDYLRFYEFFLSPFRTREFTLLELGVGPRDNKGKSLLTWHDYFPRANIVGVDVRPDAKDVETERVSIEIGNCGEPAFLRRLGEKYKPGVIIDDASHKWSHQIGALETLFGALEPGGIFIVEDLGTSFEPLRQKNYADQTEDAFSYLVTLSYLIAGQRQGHPAIGSDRSTRAVKALSREMSAIAFYRQTAVIMKQPKKPAPK